MIGFSVGFRVVSSTVGAWVAGSFVGNWVVGSPVGDCVVVGALVVGSSVGTRVVDFLVGSTVGSFVEVCIVVGLSVSVCVGPFVGVMEGTRSCVTACAGSVIKVIPLGMCWLEGCSVISLAIGVREADVGSVVVGFFVRCLADPTVGFEVVTIGVGLDCGTFPDPDSIADFFSMLEDDFSEIYTMMHTSTMTRIRSSMMPHM